MAKVLEISRDKLDKTIAAKKIEREAKKAEKDQAKEKKKAEKRAKKLEASPILKAIDDLRNSRRQMYEDYLNEVEKRGQDLTTWPIDVVKYYESIAPYEYYNIDLTNVPESTYKPTPKEEEPAFDPTKGFKPTIQKEEETVKPPFSFNSETVKTPKPKQGVGVSDEMFKKLEKAFGSHLKDETYRYEYNNGIYRYVLLQTSFLHYAFHKHQKRCKTLTSELHRSRHP